METNLLDPAAFHRTKARFDVVESVGFFEYLPTEPIEGLFPSASEYLAGAISMTRPGGIVLIGNMLDTHAQLDFVMRCIQWPYIVPRSLEQLLDVIRKAGVADEQITIHLPDDGVYAVATIEV
jgi:cyclopropane fatty-acyl-phospholipid synthase-like methyltransferase